MLHAIYLPAVEDVYVHMWTYDDATEALAKIASLVNEDDVIMILESDSRRIPSIVDGSIRSANVLNN